MDKRKIRFHEMFKYLSRGGEMKITRMMSEVGSDKVHVDLAIHMPAPLLQEIELQLVPNRPKEAPDEELDMEDVADGGGSLHYLPGCGDPPGGGDHGS